ncbi:hypothetical protein FKM82_020616 [Ascaphus truei]
MGSSFLGVLYFKTATPGHFNMCSTDGQSHLSHATMNKLALIPCPWYLGTSQYSSSGFHFVALQSNSNSPGVSTSYCRRYECPHLSISTVQM